MIVKQGIIQKYKTTEAGTLVKVFIPNFQARDQMSKKCEIRLSDGRCISIEQRSLLYAFFRDIARYSGHESTELKNIIKYNFMADCEKEYFSLSNVDMTTAREFIEYVLEFIFEHGIPLSKKVHTLAKEVNNYLYLCLKHRSCAICGERAEVHHIDAIGIGRDRTKIDHTQHRLVALCTKHHQIAHGVGWNSFSGKYHLDGIKVNAETIKKLGL